MHIIHTKEEYDALLAEADQLAQLDPPLNSDEGRRLLFLVKVLSIYEGNSHNRRQGTENESS